MAAHSKSHSFFSAAFDQPSSAFLYRFYLSACLFLLLLFSLRLHYAPISFFILVLFNAVLCADIFVKSAWKDIFHARAGFPFLVSVVVYAGFFYSAFNTFVTRQLFGPVDDLYLYVSLFLTLSLWTQFCRVRERESVQIYVQKIDDFLPKSGRKLEGEDVRPVFANELKPGDKVIVKKGERLPCDGIIVQGSTSLDEQLITGNMMLAYKKEGNPVYAGTINKASPIAVEVTAPIGSSVLMGVMNAVRNNELRHRMFTTQLDTFSAFTLTVLLVIAMGQYGWLVYRNGGWWHYSGVVLVLLSLGTPLALLFAESLPVYFAKRAARKAGIRIQNRYALDLLEFSDTMFFDKTGTLTRGELAVSGVYPATDTPRSKKILLEAAACAEQQADGPFAGAVMKYTLRNRIFPKPVTSMEMIPGVGVQVVAGRNIIFAGRIPWMEEQGIELPQEVYWVQEAVICIAKNGVYLGYLTLSDALRPGARDVVDFLKQKEKDLLLVSGDNDLSVSAVADELDIEKRSSNVLPKTKAEIVGNLQAMGQKVVMVGDGFNDIVALLKADAGIAFSSGKNVYNHWVDVLIERPDLYPIMDLFKINQKLRRTSRFNAVASLLLSVVWVEFLFEQASFHVADWRWTLGGSVAVLLLVILNSMGLLRIK